MRNLILMLMVIAFSLSGAAAQELRTGNRIATPADAAAPEEPAISVETAGELPPQLIALAVREFAEKWNTPAFSDLLGPDFYDAMRLDTALVTRMPRDARMDVLSVSGVRLLEETIEGSERHSKVAMTLTTQVSFLDSERGYQRLEGTFDIVLTIRERVPS